MVQPDQDSDPESENPSDIEDSQQDKDWDSPPESRLNKTVKPVVRLTYDELGEAKDQHPTANHYYTWKEEL